MSSTVAVLRSIGSGLVFAAASDGALGGGGIGRPALREGELVSVGGSGPERAGAAGGGNDGMTEAGDGGAR